MPSSVAVCLGGILRQLPYTAESIQKYLIEPLGADLFLSGPSDGIEEWAEGLKHFTTLAETRIGYEDVSIFLRNDLKLEKLAAAAFFIEGNWIGCYDGQGSNILEREGSGLCQMYSHKLCHDMITGFEDRYDHRYERVIWSRPDFFWTAPHIPLEMLPTYPDVYRNPEFYVLDGEDHGGLNDRHWVMRRDIMPFMFSSWDRLLNGTSLEMITRRVGGGVVGGGVDQWLDTFEENNV